MNASNPALFERQRKSGTRSEVRRMGVVARAQLVSNPDVLETIRPGHFITFVRPSSVNLARVIVKWGDQDWLISLSAWQAAEIPNPTDKRGSVSW